MALKIHKLCFLELYSSSQFPYWLVGSFAIAYNYFSSCLFMDLVDISKLAELISPEDDASESDDDMKVHQLRKFFGRSANVPYNVVAIF